MNGMLRGRRVLIVEDEPLIALMLEDMLQDLGCEIAGVAGSPEAALTALEHGRAPDAAVLDLNLHGRSSGGVADALAARGVPFLFVTGYGDESIPEAHCRRPVLGKPFADNDLAKALNKLLADADRAPASAA